MIWQPEFTDKTLSRKTGAVQCAYACRHGTCSMTPQQENALRSIARQANSEIKKARQQFPDKN
ncbi:hypothetical protein MMO11_30150, partial [Escherichia coli]|nr:hypothetical protein [Escherichia coli]